LSLVDRKTRRTFLRQVANKTADEIYWVLKSVIDSHPGVISSITWDQGKEMAYHAELTQATGVPVYLADPHSPWQRSTNENTNGVIRWWFSKGTDFNRVSHQEVAACERWLNSRPMPTLSWSTPQETFSLELVALAL
jgi:IS30 family transposase